jgi:hypothetical protein
MTVNMSSGALATALDSGLDAVFANGALDIYTGSRPADADAAPTGTLLVSVSGGADPFAAAASVVAALESRKQLNSTLSGTAVATGTAGWARLRTSGDGGGSSTSLARIDYAVVQSKPLGASSIAWNPGTSKMRVTLTGHGYSTNDIVQITGASTTALNRRWKITVIDADTFDLEGSSNVSTSSNGRVHNSDLGLDNTSIAVGQSVQVSALDLYARVTSL